MGRAEKKPFLSQWFLWNAVVGSCKRKRDKCFHKNLLFDANERQLLQTHCWLDKVKTKKKNNFQPKCYIFLKFLFSSLDFHRVPLSFLKIKFSGSLVCVAGVGWVKTAGQIFSQKPTLWCKWASTSTHEIHARATECSTLHFCIISLPCNQSSLQMLRT